MKYRAGEKESARTAEEDAPVIPAGLWKKCNKCGKPIYTDDVRANFYICPKCGGYFRVHAYRRIEMIADEGSFEEWDKFMQVSNPLNFPGYEKKLAAAREKSQLNEAIVTGTCTIHGQKTVVGVCDARFLMSSMGHNVGEKITRAVERATEEKLPVILFACSVSAKHRRHATCRRSHSCTGDHQTQVIVRIFVHIKRKPCHRLFQRKSTDQRLRLRI